MMEGELTAARIANAICQDTSFTGCYLLVEGKRDVRLYTRFIGSPDVRIRVTWGKYRQREVFDLLRQRGASKIVGIRDADFLRIRGNPKFVPNYSEPIYPTDYHDAEVMMIFNGALPDFLSLVSDDEKIQAFEQKIGSTVRELLVRLVYPLGCLRLANKRYSLGLSFKPDKPEGNRLKLHKFVSETEWRMLGHAQMVNTVWEYSQNRGKLVSPRERIAQRLAEVVAEDHPVGEIVNGHDLAAALLMVSVGGLKSKSKLLQDAGCVEDLLIACFDIAKFRSTGLFARVMDWGKANGEPAVFVAA